MKVRYGLSTGISRLAPPAGTKGFGGTEGFMAPEIMRYNGEEEYNEKVTNLHPNYSHFGFIYLNIFFNNFTVKNVSMINVCQNLAQQSWSKIIFVVSIVDDHIVVSAYLNDTGGLLLVRHGGVRGGDDACSLRGTRGGEGGGPGGRQALALSAGEDFIYLPALLCYSFHLCYR